MARNIFGSTKAAAEGNLYHYYLPKGIVNLQIAYTSTGFSADFASPSVDLLPDPDHNYFLRYTPNAFTNDQIQVSFSPQGFLKHIKTSIEDQRGEFISKVTDLATSIAKVAVPVKTRDLNTQIVHDGPIDPFNPEEVAALREKMEKLDKKAVFEIVELISSKEEKAPTASNTQEGLGIFYRPMSTFSLNIGGKEGISKTLLRLPHPAKVHFIEIPIASWVKTDVEIQFDQGGYPQSIHIVKPSSALAFIQVPINMIAAILRLPGELFKFRLDLSSSKQDALIREQELREQMYDLQKRQDQFVAGIQEETTATRGIFDWMFRSKKEDAGGQRQGSATGGGNSAAAIPSDLEDQLKKMKQDIDVIRKRVNSLDN